MGFVVKNKPATKFVPGKLWSKTGDEIKMGTFDVVDTTDPSLMSAEVRWLEKLGGSPILMKSGETVNEMVQRLLDKRNGSQITLLRIHGHGFPGFQAVASGKIRNAPPMAAITLEHFQRVENSLGRLKSAFSPAGGVNLMGCNVAEGPEGEQLLKKLANLWGVPINGSAQLQYACSYDEKNNVNNTESCKGLTLNFEGPVKTVHPG